MFETLSFELLDTILFHYKNAYTAYLDLLTIKKFGTEYSVTFYTAMDTILHQADYRFLSI